VRTRLLVLAGALLFAGCRFERRPDPDTSAAVPDAGLFLPSTLNTPIEDSVRAVVSALDDALAVGDVSRVAQLTVAGATLIDQEEGIRWARENPAGALPKALTARRDSPLEWALVDSSLTPLDGAALLVNEHHALVTGEGVPWKAVESYVLVRTPDGWRVRHLHRSRGQALPEQPL
jgi:ketosteroid isomerase-like protein